MNKLMSLASLIPLVLAATSLASVSVGPYTFDDNAFPDAAMYISGGPPTLSFPSSGDINADLLTAVNSDPESYIYGDPVRFQVDFVDNRIVNDAGADLVLFELGTYDVAEVSVLIGNTWSSALTYVMTDTGYNVAGFPLNAVAINLDDFGVAAMGQIATIELWNSGVGGTTISSSICAVGALNSVIPEPATFALVTLGGLMLFRRR